MLYLRRARVPVSVLPAGFPAAADPLEPAVLCDLTIARDAIATVTPAGADKAPGGSGTRIVDAGGALVFPAFIDAHTHLDKAHTWFRAPNRTNTFFDALDTLWRDKENWTAADLHRRAGFALRCAWAHGTRLIRTHVDTAFPGAETSHAVMAELRAEWRGRIELQTVPLCGDEHFPTSEGRRVADLALRYGASALGGFLQMSPGLPRRIEALLTLARERGVGIDLHVDENGRAESECLRLVAEAVLRTQFPLPVVCGHCCSLAGQPPDRQRATIALVKEAGIGVISLPLCNLYLQDRRGEFPVSPHWRGLTLVRDLLSAGVPVACASDNVRDAFCRYGDLDMAEVYSQSVRLAHLEADLGASVGTVTRLAANIVGRPELGRIAPGGPARFVIFTARSFSELLSRPAASRQCIDGENVHSPAPPDVAELGEPVP